MALSSATRGSSTSALADLAAALDEPADLSRRTHVGGGPLDQRLACQRGQRRQLRRLPHHGVTAHQRDRGVPRPDRDGEVERGDHTDDAERMPGLHQPVARALGGDGLAVQLPRQADRELADVDHLLHLAERLGGDLARLDRDECGEIGLVLDEQLAEAGHQRSPDRCRGGAPRRKRLRGFGYRGVGLFGRGLCDGEQHLTGDGRAGLQTGLDVAGQRLRGWMSPAQRLRGRLARRVRRLSRWPAARPAPGRAGPRPLEAWMSERWS